MILLLTATENEHVAYGAEDEFCLLDVGALDLLGLIPSRVFDHIVTANDE